MKDPYYAGLLFQIEQMICLADDEASESGVELTDSQVRSALIKATKLVQGGSPKILQETDRDQVLWKLIMSLYNAPDEILEETEAADGTIEERRLQIRNWVKALETVEDSIKTRKGNSPGSRDYLIFVQAFIANAQGSR